MLDEMLTSEVLADIFDTGFEGKNTRFTELCIGSVLTWSLAQVCDSC